MIDAGQRFPDFRLPNQDGRELSLADFAGKWLVVYVYPEDDTSDCTIQGKSFTATKAEFDALGARVVGLSEDGVASHRAFCRKFSFTIDLLSDPDGVLLGQLGVKKSEWRGKLYWDRTTFLVDPSGVVKKLYLNVYAPGHERVVLDDLAKMQTAQKATARNVDAPRGDAVPA